MKNLLSKTLFIAISSLIGLIGLTVNNTYGQEFFYETNQSQINKQTDLEKLNIGANIKNDGLDSNGIFPTMSNFFGLGGYTTQDAPAIAYIQMIINRLLGLVSFIALIIVIIAFYQIFVSKGDEGVTKAKKMLTGVAIALAIMGLSRLIVSFFFSLYTTNTGTVL